MKRQDWIAILDFGAQYNQLIARRIRDAGVYCEILKPDTTAEDLRRRDPTGIVLSGGPASVYEKGAPDCDAEIFRLGKPILGICYGMQLGCRALGAKVRRCQAREFGHTELSLAAADPLFKGIPRRTVVWMSHGDAVDGLPRSFRVLARTRNCPHAAVRHRRQPFYGVQFHPEVVHTREGDRILRNFLFKVCRANPGWKVGSFIRDAIRDIRARVGAKEGVLCALSGGVDSAVVATLLHRAIGRRLTCVFVDNGLLRKGEAAGVREVFAKRRKINVRFVDASRRFLKGLAGTADPEEKRRIIGRVFIEVFRAEAKSIRNAKFLAQGTLYPDVIESQSAFGGPSVTIKTHHNVGGLPKELGFDLIEPLRYLFKDEVRRLGRALGLPADMVERQPFPGPGLAVRVPGAVARPQLDVLREADSIVREEVENSGARKGLWQYFAVLLPVASVGVMGDARTYENAVAVRAVESVDGMTADWARLDPALLARISSRIINEVRGVNRVLYDVSSKPPATIEWE